MATFDFSQGNPEFELQKQQLNRQQKMAEALLAQGQQMAQGPAGQMVSGRYVANSPLQMLNAPVNQLVGAYLSSKGDEKAAKLAEALRTKESELLNQYMDSMTPKAAVEGGIYGPQGLTTQTTADMYGPNMELNPQYKQVAAQEAKGPDFKSAFAAAMNPYAPAYLKAQAIDMLKTQKVGEGETLGRFDLSTGKFVPFAEGGMKLAPDVKAAAQFLGITKPMNQWTEQELGAVNQKAAEMKKLTGTTVNIPNFTEKTFAGGLAEDQVKKFATLQTNAEKAPDVLANVAESKKILKSGKFFSGSPANVQLEMAKMADAFGLGGADTKTKAANTQTLITNAAGSTLDSIAGSGLGAGQGFTDKDLKFLQEAKSFRIDMTDTNIARILDLQERAAKASVGRYNQRLKTLPQASIQSMGLTPIVLPRTADDIVKE
jgi:hypothetical protein